jgi:ferredoxin
MANKITEECMSCGACEAECPNQAITQGDSIYVIDPAKCDECAATGGEAACAAVCPNEGTIVKA